MRPVLTIGGLTVRLPGGQALLDDATLHVRSGEAVVVAGPSGSGKSTLLRALFEREALIDEGFVVSFAELATDGELALVPQRGAPFDHVDVAGNIRLAIRHSRGGGESTEVAVGRWLEAVDLDAAWASERRPVAHLSGGQAQRLAVARALASGRRILFLDEPSVGLDPLRVHRLAERLRELCDGGGAAVVVVTHDPAFAAELADRMMLLRAGALTEVSLPDRAGDGVRRDGALDEARRIVEAALMRDDAGPGSSGPSSRWRRVGRAAARGLRAQLAPLAVLVRAPLSVPGYAYGHGRELLHVLRHALRQALWRPWPFYLVVSYLLGLTVTYVLASFGGEFGPEEAIRIVRGLPVIALTPPLTAFLFVATSSNAVNAWIGGLRLSKQVTAMEALGIGRVPHLWGPSWTALVIAFLVVAATFAAGFVLGGVSLCELYGMPDAFEVLTSDLLDPPPDRAPYRVRALCLVAVYAVGCASDAIARADEPKPEADAITRAMTRSVVSCTLWVVAWELVSLVILRSTLEAP